MSQQLSRQIALITIFSTCLLLVVLIVSLGIDANSSRALSQAFPLAIVCGVALTVLLSDPFGSR